MLARTGASLTALTVKVNVFAIEYAVPSFALIVIVELPLKLAAGVNVSVAPEMLGVTLADDEVA